MSAPKPIRTILCATDLSARSDPALDRAFRIAAATGAALEILTVVDEELPGLVAAVLQEELHAELENRARALAGKHGCGWSVRVPLGDTCATIVAEAERLGADLVVVGPHRTRAVLDRLRETTMERIVRLSHRPVLLVRNRAETDYASALCLIDFSPASALAARIAQALVPGGRLALLHAFHALHVRGGTDTEKDSMPFRKEIEAECAAWRAANPELAKLPQCDIIEGPVGAVVRDRIGRDAPGFVAMGAHARPPLTRAVLGSLAADLLRDPPADLLIAHP